MVLFAVSQFRSNVGIAGLPGLSYHRGVAPTERGAERSTALEAEDLEKMPLTPEQIANALGVPTRTIYFWLDNGTLPATQHINRRWAITVADVRACIRGRKVRDKGQSEQRFNDYLTEHFMVSV